MQQTLPNPTSFFMQAKDVSLQNLLDAISLKKIQWKQFLEKGIEPTHLSRFVTSIGRRTILHLAVIDKQMDILKALRREPLLKFKKDGFGLLPIDIARLLGLEEAIQILDPLVEAPQYPDLPRLSDFTYQPFPIF